MLLEFASHLVASPYQTRENRRETCRLCTRNDGPLRTSSAPFIFHLLLLHAHLSIVLPVSLCRQPGRKRNVQMRPIPTTLSALQERGILDAREDGPDPGEDLAHLRNHSFVAAAGVDESAAVANVGEDAPVVAAADFTRIGQPIAFRDTGLYTHAHASKPTAPQPTP